MISIRSIPFQGRQVRGILIECSQCGVVKSMRVNGFEGSIADKEEREQKFVKKKLEKEGWYLSEKHGDLCPGCHSEFQQKDQEMKKGENVVSIAREPSRDDKRIMNQKLHEVYDGDKTGYKPGWTDAKVAKDLGVPRPWVTSLREDMFGPEGGNEDIRAAMEEAKTLLASINDVVKPLLDKAHSIEKRLIQIEKDLT